VRILVVDDNRELRALVVQALERDGHLTREAAAVSEARTALEEETDLIVLDLGLPDGSGVAFCRELRAEGVELPILILTAHNRVDERVAGLDAGADDFLGKPFAIAELRARVRALGRRRTRPGLLLVQLQGVELDFGRRRATKGGALISVTTREWAILEVLASHAGRVVGRDEVLEAVWGHTDASAMSSLEVLVARIRRKLGDGVVTTLRGAGYQLGTA
jgi:DNA-binding response OmpR family regulator